MNLKIFDEPPRVEPKKIDVTKCGRRSGRNNSGCSVGYQQRVELSSGYATYACPPNCPQWIPGGAR